MESTPHTTSQPVVIDDHLYLEDVSKIPLEHNRLDSTLEISEIRMYFEPERNIDYDSEEWFCQLSKMPLNEQTVKLIPVSNDQYMLQITLLLENVETERKWDIPQIELFKEKPLHNYLSQKKNKCEKSEIISHQSMQMINSENVNFRDKCFKNKNKEFVKTDRICRNRTDYLLDNQNIFYAETSTSTDKNLALRCETTTQTDLSETKDGDSQTDLREIKHSDSQTDLKKTRHGDTQTDLRKTKHSDSQTDLRETKHGDSQTDLRETKHSDSQTDLRETKHSDSQTDLTETKHSDMQTDLIKTKHNDLHRETYASDLTLPLLSHNSIEDIVPFFYKNCSVHCSNLPKEGLLDAGDFSMKTVPNTSAQTYVSTKTNSLLSCTMTNKISASITTQTVSKEIRHSESQLPTECISLQDYANCYIQCDELNKDRLVDADSSMENVIVTCVETSKKISSLLSLCDITLQKSASTTQIHLQEKKDNNNQTDTLFHSIQNSSQTKECYCDHNETISTSNAYKQRFNESPIKNSDLHVVEPKTLLNSVKFLTESKVGALKRNCHPIFPGRLYKHSSSRRRTNRPPLKRHTSLSFSPKNSDARTSETVSQDATSLENKRKHTLNSSPTTRDVGKNTNLNPTLDRDNKIHSPTSVMLNDHNKHTGNSKLTKGKDKYSPKTTLTKDVNKPSLNQTSPRHHKIKHHYRNSKQKQKSFLHPLTTDDKDLLNPTFNRDDRIHSLDSSLIRHKRKYSLSPTPTKDEKKYSHNATPTRAGKKSLVPTLIRNNKKHSPVTKFEKYSSSFIFTPVEEFIIADCLKGNSKTERVIPISLGISSLALEWAAKSFRLPRNEPVAAILNPANIEFVECPTRDVRSLCLGNVDCAKITENISKVKVRYESESQNSESVSIAETEGAGSTVVFGHKSFLESATNQHFAVGLCDDCYTKTQMIVNEYLTNGGANLPASDEVELRPFCIESSSNSDEENQQKSESSEAIDIAEFPSLKSLIKNLHPSCEVVNNHLMDLKQVDKDLLKESMGTLTKRWLTVAADIFSRTKEVYDYLQYFQEFSDNLSTFVLHSTDPEGNNALHFAFGNNRFDMAEELLNNKHGPALLQQKNRLGHTPLMICAISEPVTPEDWMTVKKSVKLGNINEVSQSSGQTALMNAASRGCTEMVRVLLDAGADPNQRDGDGSTALMYATEQGREACVALLLEHPGCDSHIKDQDGQTASSIAIGAGHKDIAHLISSKTKKMPYKAMQQEIKGSQKEKSTE